MNVSKHIKIHLIDIAIFLLFWNGMVDIVGKRKTICETLPAKVEIIYTHSYEILFFALIPTGMLLVIKFADHTNVYIRKVSVLVMLFTIVVSMYLLYIAYVPLFDCGLGVPMMIKE